MGSREQPKQQQNRNLSGISRATAREQPAIRARLSFPMTPNGQVHDALGFCRFLSLVRCVPFHDVRTTNIGTEYRLNGKLHRTDGPAVEDTNGYRAWYQHGQRHRTDGPAIDWSNGYRAWFQRDKPHRTNGPAFEYTNGNRSYWQHGRVHRTDGPAIEFANGDGFWYQHGKPL